jgi:hypothetical protein
MLGLGLLGCVILPSWLSALLSDFTLPGVTKEGYYFLIRFNSTQSNSKRVQYHFIFTFWHRNT